MSKVTEQRLDIIRPKIDSIQARSETIEAGLFEFMEMLRGRVQWEMRKHWDLLPEHQAMIETILLSHQHERGKGDDDNDNLMNLPEEFILDVCHFIKPPVFEEPNTFLLPINK